MSLGQTRAHILQSMNTLPPLHEVARRLISLMGNDRTSAADLDRVIRNDQALSARILKQANSSMYGRSRGVASLTDAVVLLGHGCLTDLVLGASLDEALGISDLPGFSEAAWDHSIDCAASARAVARLTGVADPDAAFVAGLMHDIGLLVIARAAPAELGAILASNPRDPLAAERLALGVNHPQVGQRLLEQWNLPTFLSEAVRLHHAPSRRHTLTNPLINVVALADQLSIIDGAALYPAAVSADPFGLLRLCAVTPDSLPGLFQEIERSRAEAHRLLAAVRGRQQVDDGSCPDQADPPPVFAVFAADELRQAWYEGVLRYLGHPVAPWAAVESGATSAWLLADLHGAAPEARMRLLHVADRCGAGLALAGDTAPSGPPWQDAPRLPALLTRRCLAGLPASSLLLPA
jgi:HD-like signal output (HDOD) protein